MPVRYRRADAAVAREAHGKVYILPTRSGELVVLSGTGVDLWHAVAAPATIDDLTTGLANSYGVPADAVAHQVTAAVTDLVGRHVLAHA